MRVRSRERIPVVVQGGRGRRQPAQAAWRRRPWVRGLWTGAEITVTVGVVLLLLVVHQLWWTNRQAREGAERKVEALEQQWEREADGAAEAGAALDGDGDGDADEQAVAPDPGELADAPGGNGGNAQQPTGGKPQRPDYEQAYAVLSIPRLGVRVPVAQGVSKQGVLNKGYVGHYPGSAQPGAAGNFALAGHRNTHGEPFRYINRLAKGDRLVVDTRSATFTYTVDRGLPQTSARDSGVIAKVPRSIVKPKYGYSDPGLYITLTTCTPEFTSKYRLIVWGKLTDVKQR
ncbi:class E sortase [Streptomyces sp. NPDC050418]|uniref:class E sortase n=1 Tax=Streptomyces sp. NPDC050418 TaxID=3365612 RepID=UPI0037AF6FBE